MSRAAERTELDIDSMTREEVQAELERRGICIKEPLARILAKIRFVRECMEREKGLPDPLIAEAGVGGMSRARAAADSHLDLDDIDYQARVEDAVKSCRCSHGLCDGALAGGECERIDLDECGMGDE